MLVRSLLIVLFVGIAAAGSAAGQVTVLVQIEGVPGSSTLVGYEGAIEALSFSWGASNAAMLTPGGGGGASRTQFSEFSFMKLQDSASPLLLQALTTGRTIPTASVRMLRASGDAPVELSTIRLSDVRVVSQQLSGSSETPVESISLQFGRIEWEVCSIDATGARAGCNTVTWDIATNSP